MFTVRALLLSVLFAGFLGIGAELLLLNHVEAWTQLIPIVLLSLALVLLGWLAAAPGPAAIMAFQLTMVLFVAAGIIGVVLHYQGAQAFQLEVDPSLKGMALFWKTVRAKAPPALAPGSMIGLGLIGFAYTQCFTTNEWRTE